MIRLIRQFLVGHSSLQGLQALNGLLLVWWLSIPDFAVYAVFTGAMSFATQMIGFGLGPTLAASVGPRFVDPSVLGRYLRAALTLRLWTLALVSPLGLALLWYSGTKAEAPLSDLVLLAFCLLAANYLSAQTDLYQLPLKQHRKLDRLYRWSAAAELMRLGLVLLAYIAGILDVLAVGLITVAGLSLGLYGAWREGRAFFQLPADSCRAERGELLDLTLPGLPNLIFGALQGQIVIFMAALFGNTAQLAAVGALGRLSRLLGFLNAANNMIVGPAVARQTSAAFWRRVPVLLFLASSLATAISVSGLLFPNALVYVLGGKYQALSTVVWLVTLNAGLSYLVNVVGTLRSFRRWVAWWASFATIAAILLAQVVVILIAPLDTLLGVLLLGTAATSARLLMTFVVMAVARFRPEWLRAPKTTKPSTQAAP